MENSKNEKPINNDSAMQDRKNDIITMVNSIKDAWILNQIYRCIVNISKGD